MLSCPPPLPLSPSRWDKSTAWGGGRKGGFPAVGNGATLWGEGQQLWVPGGGPWGSLLMGGGVLIGVGSGDFLLLRGSSGGLCLLGRGGNVLPCGLGAVFWGGVSRRFLHCRRGSQLRGGS